MRGHDELIAMRMGGKRPAIVFINDFHCETDWHLYGDHVTISTAGDDLDWTRFRFLKGLTVSILAEREDRLRDLVEVAKKSGVAFLAGCCIDPSLPAWKQDGSIEVWSGDENNG